MKHQVTYLHDGHVFWDLPMRATFSDLDFIQGHTCFKLVTPKVVFLFLHGVGTLQDLFYVSVLDAVQ